MKTQELTYWKSISHGSRTLWTGLKLAFRHLIDAKESRTPIGVEDKDYFKQDTGIVTLQYPYESLPVPDNGRYRLHNEIDDCIVCDKCAKICPVDCIEIEPIRAPEEIGRTSDDTPKRIHAAKFDIDMAKCCFCGLCTTVCPTECLTMTKAYDFSEYDVREHTYAFAEMTPLEILEAKQKLEIAEKEKAEAKAKKEAESAAQPGTTSEMKAKPAFRPKVKPKLGKTTDERSVKTQTSDSDDPKAKALALMKAKAKPAIPEKSEETSSPRSEGAKTSSARPKPVMKAKPVLKAKPVIKPQTDDTAEDEKKAPSSRSVASQTSSEEPTSGASKKARPVFRPKPVIRKPKKDGDS